VNLPLQLWPQDAVLRFSFEIPEATPSNNVIKGMHFHAYKTLRRRWRMEVLVALGAIRPVMPLDTAFLVVTRECTGSGLDWDNAYGGLKPLLDCLVAPSAKNPDGLGLILDDSPKHMPYPPFVKQLSAAKGKSRTKVEIFEIPKPIVS
jgi:hypothetical protein